MTSVEEPTATNTSTIQEADLLLAAVTAVDNSNSRHHHQQQQQQQHRQLSRIQQANTSSLVLGPCQRRSSHHHSNNSSSGNSNDQMMPVIGEGNSRVDSTSNSLHSIHNDDGNNDRFQEFLQELELYQVMRINTFHFFVFLMGNFVLGELLNRTEDEFLLPNFGTRSSS